MSDQRRRFRPRSQRNGFRTRSNNHSSNNNGHFQSKINGSMTNPFNVEKTVQKFKQLAKDALSSGDPVLHENYLQHAEHYSRRLAELNVRSKEQKVSVSSEKKDQSTDLAEKK